MASATLLALVAALLAPPATPDPAPLRMVFQATASRGPHQAGMAYALLASRPEGQDLVAVSGSSGGALNALLTALLTCDGAGGLEADENPLYSAWGDLDWDALFPGDRSCDQYRRDFPHLDVACDGDRPYRPGDGLLSTNGLSDLLRLLQRRLTANSFEDGCRVRLSLALHAEDPLSMALGDVRVPASRRLIEVELRTEAGRLKICQADRRGHPDRRLQLTLPIQDDEADCQRLDPATLLDAVRVAVLPTPLMPPQTLDHCAVEPCDLPGRRGRCPATMNLCRARFTDGALLDPMPLGALLDHIPADSTDPVLLLDPASGRGRPPAPYEGRQVVGARFLRPFATRALLPVVGDYELQTLRRYGRIPAGLRIYRVTGPDRIYGDFAYGFAAMVHPALRRFDYYRGVVDGLRWRIGRACAATDRACQVEAWTSAVERLRVERAPGLAYLLYATLLRDLCPGQGCADWQAALDTLGLARNAPRVQPFRTLWGALEAHEVRRSADAVSAAQPLRISDFLELIEDVYVDARDGASPAFDLAGAPFPDFRRWWHDAMRQLAERMGEVEVRDGDTALRRGTDVAAMLISFRAQTQAHGWQLGVNSIPPRAWGSRVGSTIGRLLIPHRLAVISPGGAQIDWDLLAWNSRGGFKLTLLGAGLHYDPDGPRRVESALVGYTPQLSWQSTDGERELGVRLSGTWGRHAASDARWHAGAELIYRWHGVALGVGSASLACGLDCYDLGETAAWTKGPLFVSVGLTNFGGVLYWLGRALGGDDGAGVPRVGEELLGR